MESFFESIRISLLDSGALVHLPLILITLPLLHRIAPERAQVLRSTSMLYGVAILIILLSAGAVTLGWQESAIITRQTGILVAGLALIRFSGVFLFHGVLHRAGIRPPSILEDLLVALGYVIWLLIRLSFMGLDFSSLVATSAVITAVLAFAMQDTLGNILGGVALQLDDSLHIGDWIKVDDITGRIVDIGWRSTVVETRNWETVVVPNSVLMKGKFMILGRRTGQPEMWRRWVWFQVGYDIPPHKVIRVVEEGLDKANVPNVARDPRPNCISMSLDESYIKYAVRYWLTDLQPDDPTDSAIRMRIFAALKGASIAFALPKQTMHMIKESEKLAARKRGENVRQRVELLRSSGLFSSLTEEELSKLSGHLRYAPFMAGDTITQQGAVAHWLYLLVSGTVEIVLQTEAGIEKKLGTIDATGHDSFFGEMGILTGESRSASVVAASDVECYRLDKAGLERILSERPQIAEELAKYMAARRAERDAANSAATAEAQQQAVTAQEREILRRIRKFFSV